MGPSLWINEVLIAPVYEMIVTLKLDAFPSVAADVEIGK
jgi:hypothetical protein